MNMVRINLVNLCSFIFLLGFTNFSVADLVATTFDEDGQPFNIHQHDERSKRQVDQKDKDAPQVKSFSVISNVKYRYATTVVSQRVLNPANFSQEVEFTLTIPESAFISEFLMIVKEKTYKAYIKEKEDAKNTYESAKKEGKSAGHVVSSARDSNQFAVSVNVEAREKVTFNLTYEQLLQRTLGVYENVINVNPSQIVKNLEVIVNIEESSNLTVVEVADFQANEIPYQENDDSKNNVEKDTGKATISRTSDNKATIVWSPTVEQQQLMAAGGPNGQLVVKYDVDRQAESNIILVDDGYFVHFFAPSELPTLPKYVIFVLDVSGSMSGHPLKQLKEAMSQILSEMGERDYFSVVLFSAGVQIWSLNGTIGDLNKEGEEFNVVPDMMVSSLPDNIEKAKKFINELSEEGSTNIIGALRRGVRLAKQGRTFEYSSKHQPIIIFLTDGEPNVEESNPERITKEITTLNAAKYPIFSLALGSGADFKFLRKLSLSNSAFARRIYLAADTHIQLKNFYKQIASPLLSNITFKYVPDQINNDSLTKWEFPQYFLGSELVVAGILRSPVAEGAEFSLNFPSVFCGPMAPHKGSCVMPAPVIVKEQQKGHLERLWAYLRIQQLLDEDSTSNESNSTFKQQALSLALQYSFVTPLTSLVVVKPDEDKPSVAAINPEGTPAFLKGQAFSYPLPAAAPVGITTSFNGVPHYYVTGNVKSLAVPSSADSFYETAQFSIVHSSAVPSLHDGSTTMTTSDESGIGMPVTLSLDDDMDRDVFDSSVKGHSHSPKRGPMSQSFWHSAPRRPITTQLPEIPPPSLNMVSWLNASSLQNETALDVALPGVNGTRKLLTSPERLAYQNCTTPSHEKGYCRHFAACILPQVLGSVDDYMPHSCFIDSQMFLGICCPLSVNSDLTNAFDQLPAKNP